MTIEDTDGAVVLARIDTPAGPLDVLGAIEVVHRCLTVRDLHMQGLQPGALGRVGLIQISRRLMEMIDVDTIVVMGAVRTTGA